MTEAERNSSSSTRPRILLVDDDPRIARALKRALTRDHDVVAETASRRALAHVENGERFDVIITDISMPELSGTKLHAEIERIDPQQAKRMLFVTGGVLTTEEKAFLAAGSRRLLVKPCETGVLRRSIAEIMSESDTGQASDDNGALQSITKRFDLSAIERDGSSAAFIDPSGSILWVNAAWHSFGAANGADARKIGRGQNYFRAVDGELHGRFSEVAATCMASGEAFESDYDCSSSSTKRNFRMRMLPIPDAGLLITHTRRWEGEHPHDDSAPALSSYASRDGGVIVMCSNCRRVRRVDQVTWDWVPSWLTNAPAPVSHGLCPLCLDFYRK